MASGLPVRPPCYPLPVFRDPSVVEVRVVNPPADAVWFAPVTGNASVADYAMGLAALPDATPRIWSGNARTWPLACPFVLPVSRYRSSATRVRWRFVT